MNNNEAHTRISSPLWPGLCLAYQIRASVLIKELPKRRRGKDRATRGGAAAVFDEQSKRCQGANGHRRRNRYQRIKRQQRGDSATAVRDVLARQCVRPSSSRRGVSGSRSLCRKFAKGKSFQGVASGPPSSTAGAQEPQRTSRYVRSSSTTGRRQRFAQ